jgi:simple sugar transport system permease protein
MSTTTAPAPDAAAPTPENPATSVRRSVIGANLLLTFLALVLALLIGAVLIAATSPEVIDAVKGGTFSDVLRAIWESVSSAYSALLQGATIDVKALQNGNIAKAFYPLSETLTVSAPLILAGLAVAVPFRAGLFNIGVQGQMTLGAIGGGYIGFAIAMPSGLHLLASVVFAMLFGAFWAWIAGVLKARSGAHEVVTTIMLNWIAIYLLSYVLTLEFFQRPGRDDPISPLLDDSAIYPRLFPGTNLRVHLDSSWPCSWSLHLVAAQPHRARLRLETAGANPAAARTAGINVGRAWVIAMALAGALSGLAVTMNVNGTDGVVTAGVVGDVGFDAITVALLGRASPIGTLFAGLLFGGLKAGGLAMQAATGTPIDIVLVLQALIVLFIAAPALVRAVFRVRTGPTEQLTLSKGWNG